MACCRGGPANEGLSLEASPVCRLRRGVAELEPDRPDRPMALPALPRSRPRTRAGRFNHFATTGRNAAVTFTIPIWLIWAAGLFIGVPILLAAAVIAWIGLIFALAIGTSFK